jgi:hypothetical protein
MMMAEKVFDDVIKKSRFFRGQVPNPSAAEIGKLLGQQSPTL